MSASHNTEGEELIGDELPPPEADITKTRLCMNFLVSGGPFMDAIQHNQISIMRLAQDARLAETHISRARSPTRPSERSPERSPIRSKSPTKRKAPPISADEGDISMTAMLDDGQCLSALLQWLQNWQEESPTTNKLAKTKAHKKLVEYATGSFNHFKTYLDEEWTMEIREIEDPTTQTLVRCLKAIEGNIGQKTALHMALAKLSSVSTKTSTKGKTKEDGGKGSRSSLMPTPTASRRGKRPVPDDDEDDEDDEGDDEEELRPSPAKRQRR